MSSFHATVTLSETPSGEAVEGGVMPSVNMTVVDSTPDTLDLNITMVSIHSIVVYVNCKLFHANIQALILPDVITFPIVVGDLALDVKHSGALIVQAFRNNLSFQPGKNILDVWLSFCVVSIITVFDIHD
jgi:hypothetical protein